MMNANPLRRVMIKFDEAELEAIRQAAHADRRELRQQIEFLVRADLIRRGLLPADPQPCEVTHDDRVPA